MAPNSGAPSSTCTAHPLCANASAAVSPPSPPPTMRIGSFMPHVPILCRTDVRAAKSLARHSDALDFPLQLDPGGFSHAPTHGFAQRLDVGGGGGAEIDQEVAVHRRDLRFPDRKATAAGGIDELPSLVAGRVLERRSAGA